MSKVTLRFKPISKGRQSLFLDIYPPVRHPDTNKLTRKHYLSLFVYKKPKNQLERAHNNETLELAMNITANKQLDVQNQRFGFLSKRMKNANFVEYFKAERAKRSTQSSLDNWNSAIKYFEAFAGECVLFPEINETFSEEFADYLLSKPALGRANRKISTNTAVSYFAKYRAVLNQAYKDKYLPVNLYELVEPISGKATHREFLFLDELQRLANTPCVSDVVKRASLFAALTGLRFSDVSTITWEEIRGSEGNYYIQYSMEKTDKSQFHPISDEAYSLLGNSSTGIIFKDLKYSDVTRILPVWIKEAAIMKHITFHCFRHTFATLQLFLGTDIVTVSKLLGHKFVQTTMIYVNIVDKLKRDAARRIQLVNGEEWLKLREAS